MTEEDKKPKTVLFTNILIQFTIIVFYTIVWLNAPLFGVGILNVNYFLFMFICAIVAGIITLWSKANPDAPIPKKPTQQLGNLMKAITDIITSRMDKSIPQVQEIKDIIQKALVWSLREAKISPEFDQQTLEQAETYIYEKLFPPESEK